MMTAYVYGDRKQARKNDFQVEGIPIQELMIHLTEEQRGA